jgi:mono/diheme cytochrome c family protein
MISTDHGRAWRLVLALGLFAATAAVSSATLADVGTARSAGAATVATGPERLVTVQAAPKESYTAEQADRGEERYLKECEDCHGADLRGGMNGGAPLRGRAFEQKYADGVQASVMFDYMTQTMPPNQPGRYSAAVYADLMAYILKRNGFRPGAPLPSDLDALDQLFVAK